MLAIIRKSALLFIGIVDEIEWRQSMNLVINFLISMTSNKLHGLHITLNTTH